MRASVDAAAGAHPVVSEMQIASLGSAEDQAEAIERTDAAQNAPPLRSPIPILTRGQSRSCDRRPVFTKICFSCSATTAASTASLQRSMQTGLSPSKTWTAKLVGRLVVISTQRSEPDTQHGWSLETGSRTID
jgi:hypothetical protein